MMEKLALVMIILGAAMVITGVAAGGRVYPWEVVTWVVSAAVIAGCLVYRYSR